MRILTLSALALSTALSAGVASANSGVDQLAAIAGVQASDFTATQLVQLTDAQRDNDQQRIDFILSQARTNAMTRSDMGGAAASQDAQLAADAGVAPGLYTNAELQMLIDAKRNNNSNRVQYILSGDNRAEAAPTSSVSPGKAQLAAFLGLNPADYSLTELTRLYSEQVGSSDRS